MATSIHPTKWAVAFSIDRSDPERALPLLLLLMVMVTGLVDAASYLKLGQVFVANMTGNIQFAGFSFAGARGLPLASALLAVALFLLGGVAAERLGRIMDEPRTASLRAAAAIELVIVLAAMALTLLAGSLRSTATTSELNRVLGAGHGLSERGDKAP